MSQFCGVKLSVVVRAGAASPLFDTRPSVSSWLPTATVTVVVGCVASFTWNVAVLPFPLSFTVR